MKKLFWVSVAIAVLASFFASTYPDGLDFVAEKFGFAEKAQERTAPMPGYQVKFLPEGGVSTSLAGIAGVLITLSLFWLAAYILKGGNKIMKRAMVIFFLFMLTVPVYASSPYLYANTSWGAMAGGLGFDLGEGKAVDVCATLGSGTSGSTYQLYLDYFIGNWGVGINAKKMKVDSDLAFDLSFQYALEQAINEKVVVGASFTLVNYDTTANADPNWTFLPSMGAYVKLPL